MSGTLYVVGTPIGNLSDMTLRAVETLKSVDFVACEDTRVSVKLLNHFGIKKPLISYYEHNAEASGENILSRLLSGESCAVITDAGMPCISDPGEELVRLCYDNNIDIAVIPGPSAVISALAISGLSTSRFSFEGFLSTSKRSRFEHLAQSARDSHTLVFYEAPHKLVSTLRDMLEFFGDRKISLCRELTKLHETVFRTTLKQALAYYEGNNPKGEFVLVIEGAAASENDEAQTIEAALEGVRALIDKGMRPVDACRELARATEFTKSELYQKLLEE
ncbi:MAG: 16S rRNA (cytidine(1402)-2'-O)-methyltransferase [Oscillospiraceae bacterium]|jgi:16S rRNA (cytidine1402-2'-O)-methyltransferase